MNYLLFRLREIEAIDSLEAHVLARAYESAWRAFHRCAPVGRHLIGNLGLVVDFGPADSRKQQFNSGNPT